MKIEEGMLQYRDATGKKFNRAELAAELWPESKKNVQNVNMSRLINGKTKAKEDQIQIIYRALKVVDIHFLLNIKPLKK